MLFRSRKTPGPPDRPVSRPQVAQDVCVYAIGDIHGRHDLMLAMLRRIVEDFEQRTDERRCEIVFLGDYIDRGDRSRQVLDTLLHLSQGRPQRLVVLRGNHEAALLEFIQSPLLANAWLGFGARQTIADYGVPQPPLDPSDDDLLELRDALAVAMGDHLEFLETLPSHVTSGDVIFTHAGLDPDDVGTLTNDHAMLWGHASSEADWPVPGKLLVHGHFDAPEPVERPGRICVDSGAYYTGRLTAVRLDSCRSFLTVER